MLTWENAPCSPTTRPVAAGRTASGSRPSARSLARHIPLHATNYDGHKTPFRKLTFRLIAVSDCFFCLQSSTCQSSFIAQHGASSSHRVNNNKPQKDFMHNHHRKQLTWYELRINSTAKSLVIRALAIFTNGGRWARSTFLDNQLRYPSSAAILAHPFPWRTPGLDAKLNGAAKPSARENNPSSNPQSSSTNIGRRLGRVRGLDHTFYNGHPVIQNANQNYRTPATSERAKSEERAISGPCEPASPHSTSAPERSQN